MAQLPSPHGRISPRPNTKETCAQHAIPNRNKELFWNRWYEQVSGELQFPLRTKTWRIDPFFGYFGTRVHPTNLEPHYFHIGIDILENKGVNVFPIADGLLEYAGSSPVNGTYVLLSHPELQTEDGYTLHSLYLHLKKTYLGFSLLQKMLREVRFKNVTNKTTAKDMALGEVGATGNVRGLVPHLHLQVELRKKGNMPIALNPAKLLGIKAKENITKSIQSKDEFITLYQKRKKELVTWEKLWTP